MTNTTPESKPAPSKLLYRVHDLVEALGMSRPHLYQLVKRGEFPKPIKLGARAVAWPAQAIEAWIAGRAAEAQGAA